MRLPIEMIDKISELVLSGLKEKKLVVFKADEAGVLSRIREIIVSNMRAEEELDREVEGLLKSHSGELSSGGVDYRKMFSMVKTKLAKERGFVL